MTARPVLEEAERPGGAAPEGTHARENADGVSCFGLGLPE
jgi:hypothetical protein